MKLDFNTPFCEPEPAYLGNPLHGVIQASVAPYKCFNSLKKRAWKCLKL